MTADLERISRLYNYGVNVSLRPRYRSQKTDIHWLVMDSDADFECCSIQIKSTYAFKILIATVTSWSNSPISSYNLAGIQLKPILILAGASIRLEFHNTIEKTRKWNRIRLLFLGNKMYPAPKASK
jgi:hypothetical protein